MQDNKAKPHAFNAPPLNPEHTVILVKRTPPATSWWADARTRDEFNRKLAERQKEMAASYGPIPKFGGQ